MHLRDISDLCKTPHTILQDSSPAMHQSTTYETATLAYIDWQDVYVHEKPYQIFSSVADHDLPNQTTTNLVFKDGQLEKIFDARASQESFSLNEHGFAFCHHELDPNTIIDANAVETLYLPQMEQIIRHQVPDAGRVFFFDWRIRKNVAAERSIIDANDKMQHFLPAKHVHIDQTPAAVVGRIKTHLPDEASLLLQARVRVINLWRPIIDIVEDAPLAMCDLRTVHEHDLVEADHIRKQYNGSNYYARASPFYRWYYLKAQRSSEVTLIQMFDSAKHGVSGVLHTSFDQANRPPVPSKRQSIEVRALVFSDE